MSTHEQVLLGSPYMFHAQKPKPTDDGWICVRESTESGESLLLSLIIHTHNPPSIYSGTNPLTESTINGWLWLVNTQLTHNITAESNMPLWSFICNRYWSTCILILLLLLVNSASKGCKACEKFFPKLYHPQDGFHIGFSPHLVGHRPTNNKGCSSWCFFGLLSVQMLHGPPNLYVAFVHSSAI